jgi:hypothetical protein
MKPGGALLLAPDRRGPALLPHQEQQQQQYQQQHHPPEVHEYHQHQHQGLGAHRELEATGAQSQKPKLEQEDASAADEDASAARSEQLVPGGGETKVSKAELGAWEADKEAIKSAADRKEKDRQLRLRMLLHNIDQVGAPSRACVYLCMENNAFVCVFRVRDRGHVMNTFHGTWRLLPCTYIHICVRIACVIPVGEWLHVCIASRHTFCEHAHACLGQTSSLRCMLIMHACDGLLSALSSPSDNAT